MDKKINVAMAGWGSGWHAYPIKSMIEYLDKKPEFLKNIGSICRFGQKWRLEEKIFFSLIVNKKFMLRFVSIQSWKFRRETKFVSILKNIRDVFLFATGFFQAFFFLIRYRIDVVFCKWWFVALPVAVAWWFLRKKIVLHESDTHPGLVNRIVSHLSKHKFAWFPDVIKWAEVVWQIISDSFILKKKWEKQQDIELIKSPVIDAIDNSNNKKTQLLVSWWSLWSKSLYEKFYSVLKKLNWEQLSWYEIFLIWWFMKENQWLNKKFNWIKNIHIFDFVSQKEMALLCQHCDIWLCRGGSTSMAEMKLFNIKLRIVPIPWSHDQYDNAKYYVEKHNDVLLDQKVGFEKNLKIHLLKFAWFKKEIKQLDLKNKIWKTKDLIWRAIIQ